VWLWAVRGQRASEWTGRRLARNQRVLVASPDYLRRRGTPSSLEDLAQHDCLVVRENERFDVWRLQRERDRAEVRVRVGGPLSSNSGELVRDWCLAGRGIMLRSLWDIASALASGELVRVLPGHAMADADIHWLAPHTPATPKAHPAAGGLPGRALPAASPEAHALGERTTRLTPAAVSAMPATISTVIGSPNSTQAMTAVEGGTRYIRLVTLVAAPRWISRVQQRAASQRQAQHRPGHRARQLPVHCAIGQHPAHGLGLQASERQRDRQGRGELHEVGRAHIAGLHEVASGYSVPGGDRHQGDERRT
jgi:hypothetical protein